MQVLGPEVWSLEGVKILGTLVHSGFRECKIGRGGTNCGALSWVPHLQCAWQLVVQCASHRCHHLLRTASIPRGNEAMRRAKVSLLGQLPGDWEQKSAAQSIATLPMRLSGLGLRSAARMSPVACWASWADALPMLQARLPQVTANIVGGLVREGHARTWPNRIWPKPHLAKKSEFGQFVFVTEFGQTAFGHNKCFKMLTAFGQTAFGQFWCFSQICCCCCCCCSWLLLLVVGCCCLLLFVVVPDCCCLLLFVVLGPEFSGCRVKPRRPEVAGASLGNPREPKRAHLSAPALQTPPKFHEKTPRERRKNEISGGRERKKRAKFWALHPSGPPTLRAPLFLGSSGPPHLRAPHSSGPPNFQAPHQKQKLAKCGLAKFGQQELAKFGQIRMAKCGQLTLAKCGIGQIRFWPNAVTAGA